MKKLILLAAWFLCGLASAATPTIYDMTTAATPWQIVTAITSNGNSCVLGKEDYTIVHLGIQEDGSSASTSTDYVVISRIWGAARSAVTTDPNLGDGIKLPIMAGASVTLPGDACPQGPDGQYEIQFQAVGHGAKLLILKGRKP
jgi:hypothetical protein